MLANPAGLHARAAARVVRAAERFRAAITVVNQSRDGEPAASAASILALLGLAATYGDRIVIRAEGPDARDAVRAVAGALEPETFATGPS